ncbi:hypothetical protein, partial [Phaeobacter sp. S60]|uniref:hypothetical protein n=1 Tax=Phaeobacter sp. S60 TaxID=1569353 RepID=UPI00058D551E
MTDTSKEAAWDALMNYQQADEEGIMVLVSRQAIHECKDERDALRAQLQAARDEIAISEAAEIILSNRWGGYGSPKAMRAMCDYVYKDRG